MTADAADPVAAIAPATAVTTRMTRAGATVATIVVAAVGTTGGARAGATLQTTADAAVVATEWPTAAEARSTADHHLPAATEVPARGTAVTAAVGVPLPTGAALPTATAETLTGLAKTPGVRPLARGDQDREITHPEIAVAHQRGAAPTT